MVYFIPSGNRFPNDVISTAIIENPDLYESGIKVYYINDDLPGSLQSYEKGSLWGIIDNQLKEKGMLSAAFHIGFDGRCKFLCFTSMKAIIEKD